jgi:hypothetical protein
LLWLSAAGERCIAVLPRLLFLLTPCRTGRAGDRDAVTEREVVVCGRKHGIALME